MKIIAALIMSGVLLGGCASFYEYRDKVRGRRLARYKSECARYGYKYGTPHMAQCVESKYKKREEDWNRRAEERRRQAEERRSRSVDCTTTIIGNTAHTSCN